MLVNAYECTIILWCVTAKVLMFIYGLSCFDVFLANAANCRLLV